MSEQIKKALHWSAFFIACLILLPFALHAESDSKNCPDLPVYRQGQIKQVYDGDTVELSDGTKVRLLGINTPEMNYRRGHPEPLAKAARRRLKELAPPGTTVSLQIDRQQHDRYGRLLAHLQLANGTNPALTLLEEGLATILIIPPNAAAAVCFTAAERQARISSTGIWGHPRYQPKTAASLTRTNRTGYHIVRGKVTRVTSNNRFYYLELNNDLTARISKRDWGEYFVDPFSPHWPGATQPQKLLNQQVLLRGWLQPHRQDSSKPLQVRLYHPAGLEWQP